MITIVLLRHVSPQWRITRRRIAFKSACLSGVFKNSQRKFLPFDLKWFFFLFFLIDKALKIDVTSVVARVSKNPGKYQGEWIFRKVRVNYNVNSKVHLVWKQKFLKFQTPEIHWKSYETPESNFGARDIVKLLIIQAIKYSNNEIHCVSAYSS